MLDRYRKITPEGMRGQEAGFTLIELLIVIVVLGVLAAVTVLGLGGITGQSLTSACRADAKSVSVAQEAFRASSPQGSSFAPSVGALVPTYLRQLPGNTTKYAITTGSDGKVLVQNKTTGAPAVDFENPPGTPPVDPCAGL